MSDSKHPRGDVAAQLDAQRRATLARLRELTKKRDKLVFDGRWLTPDEVQAHYRYLKKRQRGLFVEVFLLYFLILVLTGAAGLGLIMYATLGY